jgi:hypothetical protein
MNLLIKQQSPIATEKKKSDKVFDRTKKLFNVALKLALVNGYDFDLKLVDINGAVVPHSNIELLINHALSHGKLLENSLCSCFIKQMLILK